MKSNLWSMSRLVTGMTLAAALSASPAAAQNLLANPGFEAGGGSYTGWFKFGSGPNISTPATDNIFRSGSAASKIFGGFVGCPGTPVFNVGGFGQAFPNPVAGKRYTLSGWSFVAAVDSMLGSNTCVSNRLIAKIVFFNAPSGGAELSSNEVVIGDGGTPLEQWLPFTVSAPVPAGAARVEALFLFLQPGCDGGSVFVDDVAFVVQEEPQPFGNILVNPSFSGGFGGWQTVGNVFEETRAFGVRTPDGSAKLFSTFVPDQPSILYQTQLTPSGMTWTLRAHSLSTCQEDGLTPGNDNFVLAVIQFIDLVGDPISVTEKRIADSTSPLGTWTAHELTALTPPDAAYVGAYILFISPTLMGGAVFVDDVTLTLGGTLDAPGAGPAARLELAAPWPNPVRGQTRIAYTLPQRGEVDMAMFDLAGRRVATVVQGTQEAGTHVAVWDARTLQGAPASAGVYQCVLRTPAGQVARSVVVIP
jgi:hypothetical protein